MARLIDADALLDKLHISPDTADKFYFEQLISTKYSPTIDAAPVVHGRWIMKKTPTGAPYTVCSHCNTSARYNDEYGMVVMNLKGANYCPNCGAKLDVG